jgi:hypothetical protein
MKYEMHNAPSIKSISTELAYPPIPNDDNGEFYRVLVKRNTNDASWSIDIGELPDNPNYKRRSYTLYCHGDPPACVREKLAMVGALGYQWDSYDDLRHPLTLMHGLYGIDIIKDSPAREIGWKINDDTFVVILSRDDLLSLRGIALDSGSKSKSES